MVRCRRLVIALLCASSACVEVPRTSRQAAASSDASFVAALASDASVLRPATAAPYFSGDNPPSANGMLQSDAGGGRDVNSAAAARAGTAGRAAAVGQAGRTALAPASDAGIVSMDGASGAAGSAAAGRSSMPGVPASRAPRVGEVVITEIMSNPSGVDDYLAEWIELLNISDETLDLGGCMLDDGGSKLPALPAGFAIEPLAYVTIARSEPGFVSTLTATFTLTNAGDTVAVVCSGSDIDRVTYAASFPLAAGASMSLDPARTSAIANDDPSVWCLSRVSYGGAPDGGVPNRGTPGAANPPCASGELDAGDGG